jgi:predicted dehydrogenase
VSESEQIRAGLIGCGDISRAHVPGMTDAGAKLVALCDLDKGNCEAVARQYDLDGVEMYTDYKALLARDDLDFVTVATPVAYHVPITLDALDAGLHVACEKPSALSVEENRKVVEAERKTGKKVIFFSARMRHGYPKLARQYIQDGDLGEIYRVDVQYYRRRGRPGLDCVTHAKWFLDARLAGGGVIMDMGQYFMDMVLDLVGWPTIDSALAYTFTGHEHDLPAQTRFDVEEHCTFLARCGGGKVGLTFDMAWVAHHEPINKIMILGTKGGIRIDRNNKDQPFTFFTNKGGPWNWTDTTTSWTDKSPRGLYPEFLQAVSGDDPGVGTTPSQALEITELTQMVLRSAKLGREVRREDL